MMTLAPIVLFVYNRLWHTIQTVEALKKNLLAEKSDLIIFSDGYKNETSIEKVNSVREYLRKIDGFKSVKIIERQENFGLAKSIITGVTEVVNKYEKLIVLEDDLVSSPFFLKYMNEGLDLYERDEDVVCIHGYNYPIKETLPETFFLKGADCWGWGTWKRGWELFETDGKKLLKELKKRGLARQFDFNGGYPYTQMIKNQISGKVNSWAILWYAAAFLKERLTLYPKKTLIWHIGNDGSGTNTQKSEVKIKVEISEQPIEVYKIPLAENKMAFKVIEKYFKSVKPFFLDILFYKLIQFLKK